VQNARRKKPKMTTPENTSGMIWPVNHGRPERSESAATISKVSVFAAYPPVTQRTTR